MKRVLISLAAAGALLGQLGAAEIYKDGDKSFGVFGVANAVLGYGYNDSNKKGSNGEFIAGIQGNSRIGINFTLGKLFGAALIGVGESTLYGAGGNTGFRQFYAGYDFGDAGKLLAGKNELVTSMGGFSSSIFNTEGGLNGFGGASTSTRRLQIAYSVAGLTFSISENDFGGRTLAGSGYEVPRFSLGYEYKDESIRAKVAVSYGYKRVLTTSTGSNPADSTKNAVLVTAGVRPVFGDQYVSALLTYGYNAEKLGELQLATPSLGEGWHQSLNVQSSTRGGDNTNIAAAMLEYGVNLNTDLAFKVGVGYQYAKVRNEAENRHSYAAFVQLPYKVGGGFSIIPQVGYLGNSVVPTDATASTNTHDVLAEVLFKLAF